MYNVLNLILLFVFVEGYPSKEIIAIVGGSTAKEKEFPFQVSLQIGNQHYCGGAILNQDFVITAAHCVKGKDQNQIRIVAGITNLKNTRNASEHAIILKPFIHENYMYPPHANDIALIKVYPHFNFTKYVNKVRLPTSPLSKDQKVLISGWGRDVEYIPKPSKKLKKAEVFVLEKCNPNLTKDYNGEFCTAHKNRSGKTGSCKGDSGGPTILHPNVLVGIIVGSDYPDPQHPICGSADYPDRHTKVLHYVSWIENIIKKNSSYPL